MKNDDLKDEGFSQEKIKEIKEQIKNNQFKINYELIAQKMKSGHFADLLKKD